MKATEAELAHDAATVCFEVIDVLGGLSELRRASATLDGSIPVRAAQACSPLLEGNRFGFQLALRVPLELSRGALGPKLARVPDALQRALSGTIPRLFAEGLLDRGWQKTIERGLVSRGRRNNELLLFTGLLLRPRPGHWLRVSHGGNRRNLCFDVEERLIRDAEQFVPLSVTLRFARSAEFPLKLSGEIATIAPLDPRLSVVETELAQSPKEGRAHATFFDQSYFDQKKRGPTQKYKRLVGGTSSAPTGEPGELRIVRAGSSMTRLSRVTRFIGVRGFEDDSTRALQVVSFDNGVPFDASFDGHECHVTPNPRALSEHAATSKSAWQAAFDAEVLAEHRGAQWYFDKYVTPHQAGEPYFFVKPPALFSTSPGWSLLVDGVVGEGFSVLRGVTASDVFHAAPAVIRMDVPGRRVHIAAGTELARLYPFPRSLATAELESIPWRWAPRLGT